MKEICKVHERIKKCILKVFSKLNNYKHHSKLNQKKFQIACKVIGKRLVAKSLLNQK